MEWLRQLTNHLEENHLALFRFSDDEWDRLYNSKGGVGVSTVARSHTLLEKFKIPAIGLFLENNSSSGSEIYFGLLKSKNPISTLESRVRISAHPIVPFTEDDLIQIVTKWGYKTRLRNNLKSKEPVISIDTDLGIHLVEMLAAIESNHISMKKIATELNSPSTYSDNFALQQDALHSAIKIFGFSPTDFAWMAELSDTRYSAISQLEYLSDQVVPIHEDNAIGRDTRDVPGFEYLDEDLTGRIYYSNGSDILEIITANRLPLEDSLGIDLIYLNSVKENVVMVQYKMLEREPGKQGDEWIFRPNRQFENQVAKMKDLKLCNSPTENEYRINPQPFYLRFVRRDVNLGRKTVTIPMDHYEALLKNPEFRGPRGGFRVSYESLDGRYLRQKSFIELVSSGYIGSHAKSTAELKEIIESILKDRKSVVAAVQAKWNKEKKNSSLSDLIPIENS